jgi:photosystem II stability/assembly factor-like uncharacterized protein
MRTSKLALLACTIVLLGAGCFGFGGSSTNTADGGVYKSVNGGQDWAQVAAVPSSKGVGTIAATNVLSLSMDPQDNQAIYLGTRENGMLYSLTATDAWLQPRTDGLKDGSIPAVTVDPQDVCTVYVARGARVYKTDNCFRSADSEIYVETRADVLVLKIAVDWFNSQVVWIGLSNGDVLKSENGGGTWRTVLTSGRKDVTGIIVSNADSRVVLVATESDGFYKTTDGGVTWTQVEKELKDWKNATRVHALVQDATGTTVLSASGYGIMKSVDFGTTWAPLSLLTAPGQVTINAVGMDPNNASLIYYAAGGTFYISTDGGSNWDTQRLPTTRQPQVLLVDPKDPNVVYVGVASVEK